IKTVSPAVLYLSGNYYRQLIRHFDDLGTEPEQRVPGDARPGDAFGLSLGTAFALTRRVSVNFGYQELFTRATYLKPDGQSWSRVIGSDSNAATLQIGATYAL